MIDLIARLSHAEQTLVGCECDEDAETVRCARKALEKEHVRTLVEVRDYLAILCGMRHWKRVSERDAKRLSQAAQTIVNEFAEHFSVALDQP